MRKSQERIITLRSTPTIEFPVLIQPARGVELSRVGTPERGVGIHRPRWDQDARIGGDEVFAEGGIVRGDADSVRYGGIEAEGFIAESGEVGEGVHFCGCDGAGGGGLEGAGDVVGAKFGVKGLLHAWVGAEHAYCPGEGRGSSFVPG